MGWVGYRKGGIVVDGLQRYVGPVLKADRGVQDRIGKRYGVIKKKPLPKPPLGDLLLFWGTVAIELRSL